MEISFRIIAIFFVLKFLMKIPQTHSFEAGDVASLELPPEEVARVKEEVNSITLLLRDRSKNEWYSIPPNGTVPDEIWIKGGQVKVIIHGYCVRHWQTWEENIAEQGIFDLGIALAKFSDSYNVLVVNWTILATEPLNRYWVAARSTLFVGESVASFLVRHVSSSHISDWGKVHALGLSLGAHTVGVLGNKVQELTGGAMVGRITGMDPAGPAFDVTCANLPSNVTGFLDKSDGKFVDIIHSNLKYDEDSMLGHLGSCVQAGHADFYPDGGQHQEQACTEADDIMEGCSHLQSIQYMIRSLSEKFLSCPCENFGVYQEGKCNCTLESGGQLMGYHCTSSASGKYFTLIK